MGFQENEARIMGNLGSTPDLRRTKSGSAVTNLSVATTQTYKTQSGDLKSETTWHRVTVFGKPAENCCLYLKKGNLVKVKGRLTNRQWKDKEGNQRYSTEITAERVDFPPKPKDAVPAEAASPAEDSPSLSDE